MKITNKSRWIFVISVLGLLLLFGLISAGADGFNTVLGLIIVFGGPIVLIAVAGAAIIYVIRKYSDT